MQLIHPKIRRSCLNILDLLNAMMSTNVVDQEQSRSSNATESLSPDPVQKNNLEATPIESRGYQPRPPNSDQPKKGEYGIIHDDEEAFRTYTPRIMQLCQTIGFGEPSELEDLGADAYHHVVGLKFSSRTPSDYIIKITRLPFDEGHAHEILDQVSVLQHFSGTSGLTLPTVIAYDTTTNNTLRTQYVLQTRIPGQSLKRLYQTLPLQERLEITTQVAELILKMEDVTFKAMGRFASSRDIPATCFKVGEENLGDFDIVNFFQDPAGVMPKLEQQSLLNFFLTLSESKMKAQGEEVYDLAYSKDLMNVVREMEAAGLMRTHDDENVLWFEDLAAGNILVERTRSLSLTTQSKSESGNPFTSDISLPSSDTIPTWSVTGVVDWDDVKSAPRVLTRSPPTWLWLNNTYEERLSFGDNEPVSRPLTTEELLIKAHFDQIMSTASPTYLEDAYHRGPWLRKLAMLISDDLGPDEILKNGKPFIESWRAHFDSTGLQRMDHRNGEDFAGDDPSGDDNDYVDDVLNNVAQLCQDIGIGKPLEVDYLATDGSHRALDLTFPEDSLYTKCVIRTPWVAWDKNQTHEHHDQIEIQQYFAHATPIPAASILAYDMTVDNVLGSQYVVQASRAGVLLQHVYYELPLPERLEIATQVADLMQHIASISFENPGRLIGARHLPERSSSPPLHPANVIVTGFRESSTTDMETMDEKPLLDLLLNLLEHRQEEEVADAESVVRYQRLQEIAHEMEAAGFFRVHDSKSVLDFWDLNPHNIILERISASTEGQESQLQLPSDNAPKTWKISELVDWDDVRSLPKVLTRGPPAWLWFNPDERESEWLRNDNDAKLPRDLNAEELLIKGYFDQYMASSDLTYNQDTYVRGPWLRELFRYAVNDFQDMDLWDRFELFEEQWRAYFDTLTLPRRNVSDSSVGTIDESTSDASSEGEGDEEEDPDHDAEDEQEDEEEVEEEYEEPFDTFQYKVRELCRNIAGDEPLEVEDLLGGSFNRVIGLKLHTRQPANCVLRIPRIPWEASQPNEVTDQVSILQCLSRFEGLRVARVLAYDSTTSNALGNQYILQERLPGKTLEEQYYKLPLSERLEIASLVAELIVEIEHVKFDRPGRLIGSRDLPPDANTPLERTSVNITGFRLDSGTDMPASGCTSLVKFLQAQFKAQKEYHSDWPEMVQRCWRFHDIAKEMEFAGLMRTSDTENTLWHWDLAARNLLAQRKDIPMGLVSQELPDYAVSRNWAITGVLDWDDVKSVPRVLTRAPPTWLWFNEDERINWNGYNDVAVPRKLDSEELLIKAHFDQKMAIACPSYIEDAYWRGYWLRTLFVFGLEGLNGDNRWRESAVFDKAWNEYFVSTGLSVSFE